MIEPDDEKVVYVEDSNKYTNSLFNESRDSEDCDFNSMFKRLSDYEDDSLDSDVEKYVVAAKAKVRRERVTSPKIEKGLLIKKPMSKSTGKSKRSKKEDGKGPGPIQN